MGASSANPNDAMSFRALNLLPPRQRVAVAARFC
jgi:hypothetical protein